MCAGVRSWGPCRRDSLIAHARQVIGRRADHAIVKAIARAFRWREMLESGSYATIREIRRGRGDQHVLRRAPAAADAVCPMIVEKILNGEQRAQVSLAIPMEHLAAVWAGSTGPTTEPHSLIQYFCRTFALKHVARAYPMNFNSLLAEENIDPRGVLIMRHRPPEPKLRRILPWLASQKPELFNAYQQTQNNLRVEKALQTSKYVASFIGHKSGKALFVGLYAIKSFRPLSHLQFWEIPAYQEMKAFGMKDWVTTEARHAILWFDLALTPFYSIWKGKLIVRWPPPELSWWRRADRNIVPIDAILEDSALNPPMPPWDEIKLAWHELDLLPTSWRNKLAGWRGVYFIFDQSDATGYVGSASGTDNILGRWRNYAQSDHGGNTMLRQRNPESFVFTIFQLVAPTMEPEDVCAIETTWKERLHTRAPYGLNDN